MIMMSGGGFDASWLLLGPAKVLQLYTTNWREKGMRVYFGSFREVYESLLNRVQSIIPFSKKINQPTTCRSLFL